MTTTVRNMIFLGRFADVDTNELNFTAESPQILLGTYSAFDDLRIVAITNHDINADGVINDNEYLSADYVQYTRGGTSFTARADSSMDTRVRVTDINGVVRDIAVAGIQMDNGDFFIADLNNAGALDNLVIRTIEVYAIPRTDFIGYTTIQNVTGTTVCFASGTGIATSRGTVPVERLRAGDMLLTLDHGPQPIRWIGRDILERPGRHAPVVFAPGSLGPGCPDRALRVSPQHRMVLGGPIVMRMFGCPQLMLPAKRLLSLPGVTQAQADVPVSYFHLLCDRHEVILANAAPCETLLLGPVALDILSDRARAAIAALTPSKSGETLFAANSQPARPVPPGARQRQLVQRIRATGRRLGSAVNLGIGALPGHDAPEPARLVQ